MNRPSNSRTLAFYLAIRPTHICTIYDFSLLPTLPIYLLYIYMYIFFVCVCARAMAAVSSLISLNFTNCQLCALVNIFTSFGLASNSWLTGPGFLFFFFLKLVLLWAMDQVDFLFPEHRYMFMSDNFFSIVLAVVFIALNANLFHVPIVLHLWVKVERFESSVCILNFRLYQHNLNTLQAHCKRILEC